MTVSDSSRPANENIPDKIIQKVSAFPNMPQTGIKLRALLAEKSDFFTPALLHDLGKLVLGPFVKTELPKIKEYLLKRSATG